VVATLKYAVVPSFASKTEIGDSIGFAKVESPPKIKKPHLQGYPSLAELPAFCAA